MIRKSSCLSWNALIGIRSPVGREIFELWPKLGTKNVPLSWKSWSVGCLFASVENGQETEGWTGDLRSPSEIVGAKGVCEQLCRFLKKSINLDIFGRQTGFLFSYSTPPKQASPEIVWRFRAQALMTALKIPVVGLSLSCSPDWYSEFMWCNRSSARVAAAPRSPLRAQASTNHQERNENDQKSEQK